MKGLENIFSGTHIILWQTEYIWKQGLNTRQKNAYLLDNIPLTGEKMHLAAIIVDTKSFREVKSYHRTIPAPFSLYNKFIKLNLYLSQEPEIIVESPLASASRDFLDWTQGLELYSWGDDFKGISENTDLNTVLDHYKAIKFHDIRYLFKAYGIPADNYLSNTVLNYFDRKGNFDAQTPLDNCRLLATALRKLAKTV